LKIWAVGLGKAGKPIKLLAAVAPPLLKPRMSADSVCVPLAAMVLVLGPMRSSSQIEWMMNAEPTSEARSLALGPLLVPHQLSLAEKLSVNVSETLLDDDVALCVSVMLVFKMISLIVVPAGMPAPVTIMPTARPAVLGIWTLVVPSVMPVKTISPLLVFLEGPRSFPWIEKCLRDVDVGIRCAGCNFLSQVAGPEAVGRLLRCLREDPSGWVRFAAVEALEDCRDISAIPALEDAMQDDTGTDFEGRPISKKGRNRDPENKSKYDGLNQWCICRLWSAPSVNLACLASCRVDDATDSL
jgi:hypothetical protein